MARRYAIILALVTLAALLACNPSGFLGTDQLGAYVENMQQPMADIVSWSTSVGGVIERARTDRAVDALCGAGGAADLITEGQRIRDEVNAIEAPRVASPAHHAVLSSLDNALELLGQARIKGCDQNDVQGALTELGSVVKMFDDFRARLQDLQDILGSR